jgi:transcription elongation factor Elf1
MAAKAEKIIVVAPPVKPIFFTCKFCGESKPLQDLIVIRRFYPQLTACKECARNKRIIESDAVTPEETVE